MRERYAISQCCTLITLPQGLTDRDRALRILTQLAIATNVIASGRGLIILLHPFLRLYEGSAR